MQRDNTSRRKRGRIREHILCRESKELIKYFQNVMGEMRRYTAEDLSERIGEKK
jgi:hypothetical protein